MEDNNQPTQFHLFIKPVEYYLINGPIPAADLMYLDFLESYLNAGIIDTTLDVHFMLESISINGAPEWWKGSVAEFEEEFHEQYQRRISDLNKDPDFVWEAAYEEVKAKRLSPLPEDSTKEQVKNFLDQGKRLLQQTYAVELLMDMWCEAMGV